MFYKLALNTTCGFFCKFQLQQERFMHTAKINFDGSRAAFGTLY
jgi:hypothetical protein